MRQLSEIRDTIRQAFVANTTLQTLYSLNPALTFAEQFSSVSIEAAFVDIAAFISFTMEGIFDLHKKEVDFAISEMKPHTTRWYRNKALSFRLGQPLIADSDDYSDVGLTEQAIAASQVVKYAAAVEALDGSGIPLLRIKAATLSNNQLSALPAPTIAALSAYFAEVKDAGVKLLVTSDPPDSLRATVEIYFDPLVLDANGLPLNGGAEPVRAATDNYLQNLPFNGELSLMAYTDVLQNANGVIIAQLQIVQANYGALPYQNIGVRYIPDAGYMRVYAPADLTIIYKPYTF